MKWEEMSPRERDALVARRVLGWSSIQMRHPAGGASSLTPPSGYDPSGPAYRTIPRYTTDISAAWEVVEKMGEEGWDMELRTMTEGCVVSFQWYAPSSGMPQDPISSGGVDPRAGNEAYAICFAALRAKGVEV